MNRSFNVFISLGWGMAASGAVATTAAPAIAAEIPKIPLETASLTPGLPQPETALEGEISTAALDLVLAENTQPDESLTWPTLTPSADFLGLASPSHLSISFPSASTPSPHLDDVLLAQDATAEPATEASGEDKTGTNPTTIRPGIRVFSEYRNLPGSNANQFLTTFRGELPVFNGEAKFRVDVPLVYTRASIALPDGLVQENDLDFNTLDIDQFGLGDTLTQLSTTPYLTPEFGVNVAAKLYLPTATDRVLGTGKWALGPAVTTAFFFEVGGGSLIFAPTYEHRFSFAGNSDRNDIHLGIVDLYLVYRTASLRNWLTLDPTILFNYNAGNVAATLELEAGQLIAGGTSVYIRPGVGIGANKPYDWNLEGGVKVVF